MSPTPIASGKVRDIYDAGGDRLLLVATDRISAYDVVMPTAIPDKGRVLTGLSEHWFARMADLVPNHLISTRPLDLPGALRDPGFRGRAMLVRRLQMFPIECVARGYLAGSGWREYREAGTVCGHTLPSGLREGDRLPEPIFTPATKAATGHDENITLAQAAALVGVEAAARLEDLTLRIYARAHEDCAAAGIVLADTKLEFGTDPAGAIVLGDEAITPDSSRFWPRDGWAPGGAQPSYDKQFVRDWLDASGWDHTPPAPRLPEEVVRGTRQRYVQAYERITGHALPTEGTA